MKNLINSKVGRKILSITMILAMIINFSVVTNINAEEPDHTNNVVVQAEEGQQESVEQGDEQAGDSQVAGSEESEEASQTENIAEENTNASETGSETEENANAGETGSEAEENAEEGGADASSEEGDTVVQPTMLKAMPLEKRDASKEDVSGDVGARIESQTIGYTYRPAGGGSDEQYDSLSALLADHTIADGDMVFIHMTTTFKEDDLFVPSGDEYYFIKDGTLNYVVPEFLQTEDGWTLDKNGFTAVEDDSAHNIKVNIKASNKYLKQIEIVKSVLFSYSDAPGDEIKQLYGPNWVYFVPKDLNNVNKFLKDDDIDASNNAVTWEILVVAPYNRDADGKITLTDTVPEGFTITDVELSAAKVLRDGTYTNEGAFAGDLDIVTNGNVSNISFKPGSVDVEKSGYILRVRTTYPDTLDKDKYTNKVVLDGTEARATYDYSPMNEVEMSKSGFIVDDKPGFADWTITIKRNKGTLGNLILKDIIGSKHEYVSGTLQKAVDNDPPANLTPEFDAEGKLNLGDELDSHERITLTFRTAITEETFTELIAKQALHVKLYNTAQLFKEGETKPILTAPAKVTVPVMDGTLVRKKVQSDSSHSDTTRFEVVFNRARWDFKKLNILDIVIPKDNKNEPVPTYATLNKLSEEQVNDIKAHNYNNNEEYFTISNIKYYRLDENATEILIDPQPTGTVTQNKGLIEASFDNVNYPIKIVYEVKMNVPNNGNTEGVRNFATLSGDLNGGPGIGNGGTIEWPWVVADGGAREKDITIRKDFFKGVNNDQAGIDYNNKIINWRIKVDNKKGDANEIIITDTPADIKEGNTVVATQKVIIDSDFSVSRYANILTLGTDYNLYVGDVATNTWTKVDDLSAAAGEYESFKVELLKSSNLRRGVYYIVHNTKYELKEIRNAYTFVNNSSLNADFSDGPVTRADDADFSFSKHAFGNAVDKKSEYDKPSETIIWNIYTNKTELYNGPKHLESDMNIPNQPAPNGKEWGEHTYNGDLKIYEYRITANGGYEVANEVTDISTVASNIKYENNILSMDVDYSSGKRYLFRYSTTPQKFGNVAFYDVARLEGEDPAECIRELTNSSVVISKTADGVTGSTVDQDAQSVDWTVLINKNGLTLDEGVFTDELGENLYYEESASSPSGIKVDVTSPDGNTVYEEGVDKDYTISHTQYQDASGATRYKFILTTVNGMDAPWMIKYKTYFGDNGNSTFKVKNTGTFNGATASTPVLTAQYGGSGGASYKLYKIVLRKLKENTDEILTGARFEISRWDEGINQFVRFDSNEDDKLFTVNSDGEIVIPDALKGRYKAEEKEAPAGYVLADPVEFVLDSHTVDSNDILEVKVRNFKGKDVVVRKVGTDGKALEGATFTLTENTPTGNGETYTADVEGNVHTFKNVKYGTYTLTETVAPNTYKVSGPFEITVDANGVSYNGPSNDISVVPTDNSLKVINHPKYEGFNATIKVIKYNEDKTKKLAGAVFGLYTDDFATNQIGPDYTTDANGEFTVKNLAIDPNTGVTSYYVKEKTPPTGYKLNTTVFGYPFNATTTVVLEHTFEIKNIPLYIDSKASIKVMKTGKNDEPLEGAEFTLYRDKELTDVVGVRTTDADGAIYASGIKVDPLTGKATYYGKETKAPEGYMLSEKVYTIEFDAADPNGLYREYAIKNYPLGRIELTKVSDTGGTLAGAKFGLYSDSDATVLLKEQTSGSDGKVVFDNLDVDEYTGTKTYYVKEISAPSGYNMDTQIRSAVLDANTADGENVNLGEIVNRYQGGDVGTTTTTTTVGGGGTSETTTDITETSNPEAGPTTNSEDVSGPTAESTTASEDNIDDEALPKTGGIPLAASMAFGLGTIGLGAVLLKKKK